MFPILEEFGFPIRGAELRDWLMTSGSSIFKAFETGSQALEWLRDQGGAIRTADFYNIRRDVLQAEAYTSQIRELRDESLVPIRWTYENHGLNLSTEYLYRVKVWGVDPDTLERVDRWISISSDIQLTAGEIKDKAFSLIAGEEGFYKVIPEEASVEMALRRPRSL